MYHCLMTSSSVSRCSWGALFVSVCVLLQCVVVLFLWYKEDAMRMICQTTGDYPHTGMTSSFIEDTTLERPLENASSSYLRSSVNVTTTHTLTSFVNTDDEHQHDDDDQTAPAGDEPAMTTLISEPFVLSTAPMVFEGVKVRAFPSWPIQDLPLPCFEPEIGWKHSDHSPCHDGFIFVKPYKVGSSTASGINLRIARNVAKKLGRPYDICKARYDHTFASQSYNNYRPQKTFLWTLLRDPSTRVVSQFFHFEVSRKKVEPSDANFLANVRDPANIDYVHDYYLTALSLDTYHRGKSHAQDYANQIIQKYNFIAITERMDESAVVLAMLLGLSVADTLYLTAKAHGGWDDAGGRDQNICTYIVPSFVSEGVQGFLDSAEWQTMSHWDRILWQAANRSLDLTIERLGKHEVERNLQIYRAAKEKGQAECLPRTKFPCSIGGKYNYATNCLWKDSGCGMECLDEVSTSLGLL